MKSILARLLMIGIFVTGIFGMTACSSSVEVETDDDGEQEVEIKNR